MLYRCSAVSGCQSKNRSVSAVHLRYDKAVSQHQILTPFAASTIKGSIMNIWVSFWMVAIIWGSSFMLIRIGVADVHPLHLVFLRTGIAAVGLGIVVTALRRRIPRDPKTLLSLIVIGVGNNALPFLL